MAAVVQRVTTPAQDPAWRITGYDTVRRLLADPRLGRTHADPDRAARYSVSAIFGRPQPASPTERDDHARMRRLLSPSFSARRLAVLRDRVQQLVDGLLDAMSMRVPPVNFHEAVSFPLPALVICELLGVPYEDREDFRRWSDDAADMTDEARSLAGLGALWQYMQQLIERKRGEPADDVLSELLAAQQRDPASLPTEQVAQLAAGLLFAGHETTVAAIDKGVLLLTDPEQRDALRRDPALVAGAVEEILRLPVPATEDLLAGSSISTEDLLAGSSISTGLPRWANADIDVDGTTIRAGELVLLDLQGSNLDPQRFAAPESCDPGRADNAHLTFGYGPYFCLGAPLARIELQVLFGSLFRRFPTLRVAVPFDELRHRPLLTGGLAELPVTW